MGYICSVNSMSSFLHQRPDIRDMRAIRDIS